LLKDSRLVPRKTLIHILLGVLLLGVSPRLPAQEAERVLARAGKVFITEREFLERFELTPALYRSRKGQLEGDKLTTLYSLVAEKLLAQEATDRQLEGDSLFQSALAEVTKLLARDELYRQEVARKVTVGPDEIRQGMKQAQREIRVRFLFSPDSGTIAFLRTQIRSAGEFDRLIPDSSMQVLRDTATVIWGDAEPAIEDEAYRTNPGSVSAPVRAGDGWYILRVLSSKSNPATAGLSLPVRRERVLSLLRRRKEQVRQGEFLSEVLKGKTGFSPPATFRAFAANLAKVMRRHYVPPSTALSLPYANELRDSLREILPDTLVVAGSGAWSVDEVIDRLLRRGFTVSGDSVRGVASRLHAVLEEMVVQELLAQEALSRGLDRVPDVRRKLETWRDHYLSGMTRRSLNRSVAVTNEEVYRYLQSESPRTPIPEVRLREFRAPDRLIMAQAARLLEQGVQFGDVVRRLSSDPRQRERGGLTEFFPVTERQPLGMIAAQLDSGQVYGPVSDSLGLLMIQLVGRRNTPAAGDTGRLEQGRTELLRLKQQRMLTLLIAQSARDRGVEVFEDRLKALQVNPLPMVAYRLLGFGGRMFEVPFVEPQIEWLSTEPPAQKILP
jgi:parvulin-like peptidyl-prolyl isomerase